MHNKLILQDIHNRVIIVAMLIYNIAISLVDILDSEIIVQLIEHEKIKFDYKIIISIISCAINIISFIYFIIISIKNKCVS